MTRTFEAIFTNGVLKPVEPLPLREQERVRVTVEDIQSTPATDRDAAIKRFQSGVAASKFRSTGPLPTREQPHDRG